MCLPMGCSVSFQTFEALSCALQWICMNKFRVSSMSHILDDFIFFGPPRSGQCQFNLDAFFTLCRSRNLLVKHAKTVLPTSAPTLKWHFGGYLCTDINSAYGQADAHWYNAYTSCLGGNMFACVKQFMSF